MIRTALFGTMLLSLLVVRPARAEEIKIAVVDVQKAIADSDDGKKALTSFKKDFDKKQKELDEQQDEVRKAAEDLKKKSTLLPAETLRQKEAEIQERIVKVQQTYMRLQQDLAKRQEEATTPLLERMHRIINKIAAAEGFTLVLDRSAGVVFAKEYLDLTGQVIRRFNAGEEKGAAPAKKAAPADSKKK